MTILRLKQTGWCEQTMLYHATATTCACDIGSVCAIDEAMQVGSTVAADGAGPTLLGAMLEHALSIAMRERGPADSLMSPNSKVSGFLRLRHLSKSLVGHTAREAACAKSTRRSQQAAPTLDLQRIAERQHDGDAGPAGRIAAADPSARGSATSHPPHPPPTRDNYWDWH